MARKRSTGNRPKRNQVAQLSAVSQVPTDFSLKLARDTLVDLDAAVNKYVGNKEYIRLKLKWMAAVPDSTTALQYLLIGRSGVHNKEEICGKKARRVNNRQTWTGHAGGRCVYPTSDGLVHITVWRQLREAPAVTTSARGSRDPRA